MNIAGFYLPRFPRHRARPLVCKDRQPVFVSPAS